MRLSARLAIAFAAGLVACAAFDPPIVQTTVVATQPGVLQKVAVAPFAPSEIYTSGRGAAAVPQALAAELVTRFVTEALAAQGIGTVAPNDLVIAFEGEGNVLPRGDAKALGGVAARHFGATGVLTGRVFRYREREGGSSGAFVPASVAFDFTLQTADGTPVYRARFDHTQSTLSGNVFGAARYPGNGLRWLTVAELTRWGADHAVSEMPPGLR